MKLISAGGDLTEINANESVMASVEFAFWRWSAGGWSVLRWCFWQECGFSDLEDVSRLI
jgi:hypothetical protein